MQVQALINQIERLLIENARQWQEEIAYKQLVSNYNRVVIEFQYNYVSDSLK